MLAAGAVWRNRTVVFDARDAVGRLAVVKETYCRVGDSVREDRLLRQVHARGDVPGVVRLRLSEVVEQGGEALQCRSVEKLRLVMWDRGVPLEQARSVNDLLCCFYDVLEGELHRTACELRWALTYAPAKFIACCSNEMSCIGT